MGTLSVDKILKTSTGAAEFTLPAADGTAGQAMITDGSGQLSLGEVTAAGIATDAVGVAQLSATGTASATTFLRGDNAWTGVANTPSFRANMSANQNITASTVTKVAFDTELWDTNSAYDAATNYRFTVPTGEAGKYIFTCFLRINGTGLDNIQLNWRVNNATGNTSAQNAFTQTLNAGTDFTSFGVSGFPLVVDLAVADYIEAFVFVNTGSSIVVTATSGDYACSSFAGFKLAGV